MQFLVCSYCILNHHVRQFDVLCFTVQESKKTSFSVNTFSSCFVSGVKATVAAWQFGANSFVFFKTPTMSIETCHMDLWYDTGSALLGSNCKTRSMQIQITFSRYILNFNVGLKPQTVEGIYCKQITAGQFFTSIFYHSKGKINSAMLHHVLESKPFIC